MITPSDLQKLPFDPTKDEKYNGKSILLGDTYENETQLYVSCNTPDDVADVFAYIFKVLDIAKVLTNIDEYAATRVTHLVKLSRAGKGGFFRTGSYHKPTELLAMAFDAVTEDDFSREESLYGNAAYQKMAALIIGKVHYNNDIIYLSDFIVEKADASFSTLLVLKTGLSQSDVNTFIRIIKNAQPANVFRNEAQVFVPFNNGHKVLSVISPFSLPIGMYRARQRLYAQYKVENTQDDAKGLYIPTFNIPIGGGNPQNAGLRVGGHIQVASVFNKTPTIQKTHNLSRYVFNNGLHLIQLDTADLYLPKGWLGNNYHNKKQRQRFFEEIVLMACAKLFELRRAWENSDPLEGETLDPNAIEHINTSADAWALFIKGASSKEEKELSIAKLNMDVFKKIKTALHEKFQSSITDTIDEELKTAIAKIIRIEHA